VKLCTWRTLSEGVRVCATCSDGDMEAPENLTADEVCGIVQDVAVVISSLKLCFLCCLAVPGQI
jgi:hypothetical protein